MIRLSDVALVAVISVTSTAVAAGECSAVKQQVPDDALWTCSAAWSTGNRGHSATECFSNPDEGFTWLAKQFARAGQIRQATCRNQGKTVRYRDWNNQRQGTSG